MGKQDDNSTNLIIKPPGYIPPVVPDNGENPEDDKKPTGEQTGRPVRFRVLKLLLALLLSLIIIAGGIWWFLELPSPLFFWDYSTLVLDQEGEIIRVFLNSNEQWIFPPSEDKIPEKLALAVINYEDKRFYNHPGIDPLGLGRAVIQNIRARRVVSGASTITMQVARLSRPKERSLKNKLIEMVQALKIEQRYSKEEILTLYLNHAPYGSNIIGYRTASYRYFGKDPAELTWGEAAILAVLPNSPGLINPVSDSQKLEEKRDRLLAKLQEKGIIGGETYRLALEEPVPEEQIPFRLAAPHLTERLQYSSDSFIVQTTISSPVQERITRIASDYMREIKQQGIKNCALLAVDTESGAVKAYIGSQDYFDDRDEGKINGVLTARSTGSILKPFLYGLAMDRGMIIPESKIEDIPENYGAYTPYNYDGTFRGMVTAREALVSSLNAPAVDLLDRYGVEQFYNFLEDAGITTLFRTPDQYGLPLILGGAEANLWEVVSLYRGLANLGRFSELHIIPGELEQSVQNDWTDENEQVRSNGQSGHNIQSADQQSGSYTEGSRYIRETGEQLISEGSAYLVLDILKDLTRPGVEAPWRRYASSRQIGWKTGTSYGNRDAWAVGVTPELAIGVWLGNFDSSPSKGLTGLEAAAPLLFRIFDSLKNEYNLTWYQDPVDLQEIKISALTGYPINEILLRETAAQPEMVTAERPASADPLQYSPYERTIYLNQAGSEEVCSLCWDRNDLKKVVKAVYPPQVAAFLKACGNQVYTIPAHNKYCPNSSSQNPIEFIYPREGSVIMVPRGLTGDYQQVSVKIAHSKNESSLFWYLDDSYIGATAEIHQLALDFKNGWHRLHVVDQDGSYLEIQFYTEKREE